MELNLPVIAGTTSTIIFAFSTLPMLVKAYQTKDLRSYSPGQILLANVGNVIHSIYVFHLPPGPIWLLHAFYLVSTGLMMVWYLRYEWWPGLQRRHQRVTMSERNGQSASRRHTPSRTIPL
jgi:uncharacterized protein with PQ loop repeat